MSIRSHFRGFEAGLANWFLNQCLTWFPSKRIRRLFFRVLGVDFKGKAKFYAGVQVRNPKGIHVGEGVSVGPGVLLDGRMGLTLGKNSVIAYEAILWTLNHDYNDVHFCGKGAPVVVGDYAWICSRATVLPGITIGEGAVVAAGAVVTKNVEPYAVVAGVPAKVIGHREKKSWEYGYGINGDSEHII